MNYQQAWKELEKLINVLKEFNLGDEAESLILSIEHIQSNIQEPEHVNS